eukprot:TRINITY_DN31430_c0_g1_i1.p1 TRINITY_DN31430_c0_g1~~TRINITY_DN31430_c0_g1_i1.p1  ORF type:complete len:106 (-),score=11.90 TRINITY_DN31430_c0_g1_i1:52-369(-)
MCTRSELVYRRSEEDREQKDCSFPQVGWSSQGKPKQKETVLKHFKKTRHAIIAKQQHAQTNNNKLVDLAHKLVASTLHIMSSDACLALSKETLHLVCKKEILEKI